jgi:hypothetical protein
VKFSAPETRRSRRSPWPPRAALTLVRNSSNRRSRSFARCTPFALFSRERGGIDAESHSYCRFFNLNGWKRDGVFGIRESFADRYALEAREGDDLPGVRLFDFDLAQRKVQVARCSGSVRPSRVSRASLAHLMWPANMRPTADTAISSYPRVVTNICSGALLSPGGTRSGPTRRQAGLPCCRLGIYRKSACSRCTKSGEEIKRSHYAGGLASRRSTLLMTTMASGPCQRLLRQIAPAASAFVRIH